MKKSVPAIHYKSRSQLQHDILCHAYFRNTVLIVISDGFKTVGLRKEYESLFNDVLVEEFFDTHEPRHPYAIKKYHAEEIKDFIVSIVIKTFLFNAARVRAEVSRLCAPYTGIDANY